MKFTEFYFMIKTYTLFFLVALLVLLIILTLLYVLFKSAYNKLFKKNCAKCKYCFLRNTPHWYNCRKRKDIEDWKGDSAILEHWEKCKDFEDEPPISA